MSRPRIEQGIRLVPKRILAAEIRSFLIDRQARGLSPGTIEFYRKKLRYLRQFLEDRGITRVESITPDLLRRYLLTLGNRLNPGGVHACYRAMRTFLRWWEHEIEPEHWTNPITKVHPPRVPQQPLEPLSLADLKAMLKTCKPRAFAGDRDRAILLALLDTGCRASEFVALDVGDVNLVTGSGIVRRGKGSKQRVVFLGTKARRALLWYLRHRPEAQLDAPLWVTRSDTRLKYPGLRQIVRRRAIRADVPVPSLHSFRRAFAILSLRSGADLITLQRLMGHANLSVLRRYLAQTEDDLRAAHEKHGPVDHMV